jgi:hypothetical protein
MQNASGSCILFSEYSIGANVSRLVHYRLVSNGHIEELLRSQAFPDDAPSIAVEKGLSYVYAHIRCIRGYTFLQEI